MKKTYKLLIALVLTMMFVNIIGKVVKAQSGSALYAGGPMYYNRDYSINEVRNSGFTCLVVWTIHIDASGNLNFNAEFPLVTNGSYVGASTHPNFASDMALLKTAPTSVTRLEFGLAAWGSSTFANIKALVNSEGTGSTSKLYKNFQTLKSAIPSIDAINFDDENTYDAASATAFAVMLADLGYKITLCPYTSSSYWQSVAANTNNQRAGAVDLIMLQCYDGGAGNNPCTWDDYFPCIPVWPGLWDRDNTPSQVQTHMDSWQTSCNIKGGFMWLYDDFKNTAKTAQYANAINTALDIVQTVPGAAVNPNPTNNATSISTTAALSWSAGSGETSHNVYFGTANPPASIGN
ncbi:MAG: hypothetical protein EHM93_11395 [Bacteroidales bacterium]|nr:MAG: hypothetical protein EHM93_11395 [Bacteroidales bacterium]